MITIPTNIIIALTFNFFDKWAAIGAAQTPPKIKPKIGCQFDPPIIVKKVKELAKEMKNSAKLTEPIINLGFLPLAINVEETTGPHPPPPIESRNPPVNASQPTFLTFFLLLLFLITFRIILIPKINV